MTEQTIRTMAKQLAGKFYEDNRTPGFRKAFPTFRHYSRGQWVQSDGSIVIKEPGWTHHIKMAKRLLTEMLSAPSVTPYLKNRIYDALIDEHGRASGPHARTVLQRQERPN